jgi:P2X purinoceptor 7
MNGSCTFHKTWDPQCSIFRLGDIFQEAGENFTEVAVQVGEVSVQWFYGGWGGGCQMSSDSI